VNDKPEIKLLGDLIKLLKKYGIDTFSLLIDMLSTPEFNDLLVATLTKTIEVSRISKAEKTETKRTPRDFRSSLVELGISDPEKSDLLLKFHDNLMGKNILPTLRDIQAFVSDTGLPSIKSSARSKAIVPLIKSLSELSLDELRTKIAIVKAVSSQNDRSLEGWSNIILDKERRGTH